MHPQGVIKIKLQQLTIQICSIESIILIFYREHGEVLN